MRRNAIESRPTSRAELAEWYSDLLEQQAASGLSVTAFAAQVGLSAWTLYEWRRRLLGTASTKQESPPTGPRLIEVSIARPELPGDAVVIVRLVDGRRSIAVPHGFDGEELRRLVSVLESC